MAIPNITGFTTGENLGIGQFGLNEKNLSSNKVFITGDNMAQGLAVNVTNNAGVTWSGSLGALNNGSYPATLACANSTSGMGGSQNVDVTVGSGNETSPKKTYSVPVGTH
jgi:hypothetical protein